MQRTLTALVVVTLALMTAHVISVNARWREQVALAEAREAQHQVQVRELGVRWRVSADSADQLREQARLAERRASAAIGRLDSLRRVVDTVTVDSVPVLVAVIAAQDTVVAEQQVEIVSLRASNDQLRAGASLLSASVEFAVARGDSLKALIDRAPVVQLTAPRPKTGWLVAGALVAGILVGVF